VFRARDGRVESASVLQLIYNPVAGRGRAQAGLQAALRLLDESGAAYQLHTSAAPGHATALAAATPPGSVVVAVGGDGTVNEVVRGLVLRAPRVNTETLAHRLGRAPSRADVAKEFVRRGSRGAGELRSALVRRLGRGPQ